MNQTYIRRESHLAQFITWLFWAVFTVIAACASQTGGSASLTKPLPDIASVPNPISGSFVAMSFNVLHPTDADAEKKRGWNERRELVLRQIAEHRPDILFLQEVVSTQKEQTARWLREQLTRESILPRYVVVAGAGDEPKDIFVNIDMFEVLFPLRDEQFHTFDVYGGKDVNEENRTDPSVNTVFLPPDPVTVCSSPINTTASTQVRKNASFALLRHRASQKDLVVANVHLHWQIDRHQRSAVDTQYRAEQLRCISDVLHARFGDTPKIVAGDFNAEPNSDEIALFTSGFGRPQRKFTPTGVNTDSPQGTWTKFCEDCTPTRKIDHIFVQGIHTVSPSQAVQQKFDGQWPSDHCPVMGVFGM